MLYSILLGSKQQSSPSMDRHSHAAFLFFITVDDSWAILCIAAERDIEVGASMVMCVTQRDENGVMAC
jgi:hypothetical protein